MNIIITDGDDPVHVMDDVSTHHINRGKSFAEYWPDGSVVEGSDEYKDLIVERWLLKHPKPLTWRGDGD